MRPTVKSRRCSCGNEASIRPEPSPSLVKRLADLFPESSHTEIAGLARNDDRSIWQYCLQEGFVVVSKDNDFGSLATESGAPPKAIWIRLGNCTTNEVETAIRRDIDAIRTFGEDPEAALLIVLPAL
jgi:predicted nuclease of predicted toxin-antitoxin system